MLVVSSRLSPLFKKSVIIVECQESLEERAEKKQSNHKHHENSGLKIISAYGTEGLRVKYVISGSETSAMCPFICFC